MQGGRALHLALHCATSLSSKRAASRRSTMAFVIPAREHLLERLAISSRCRIVASAVPTRQKQIATTRSIVCYFKRSVKKRINPESDCVAQQGKTYGRVLDGESHFFASLLLPKTRAVFKALRQVAKQNWRFTYGDYAVFMSMLASSGAVGLYCAFNNGPQNSIRQLLAADGKLPPLAVSTSLMASFISASYILGNASEIYLHGTMYFFILAAYCLVIPVTSHFYMPVFFRNNVLTCYEYLELRFNRVTRCVAVACYILQMLIYISIQLYAPALALSYVTGMSLWSAVVAIGLVCTIYTSVGGIKAVVYTDTLQAVCMIASMIVVVTLGFKSVGGFSAAWEVARSGGRIRFDDANVDPTVRHTIWGLLIGSFFTNLASYATNQMMVLRYLTVSSLNRAKLVVWVNLPYLMLILTLSCLAGIMVFAHFHSCDPVQTKQILMYDQLLPYFVMVKLGTQVGLPGVFVAGIFAASLSSISSGVNALANVLYVDVVALIWPKLGNETGSRTINVLGAACGMLSIALVAVAQSMGDVMTATNAVNSAIGGPLLALFTVAIFMPFVNTSGALWGFVLSLAVSLWLNVGSFLYPTFSVANSLLLGVDETASSATTVSMLSLSSSSPSLSVAGCVEAFRNASGGVERTVAPQWIDGDGLSQAYRISYVWYTAISFVVGVGVALVVSFVTGVQDPRTLNPDLVSRPFDVICPWLSAATRDRLAFHVGERYEKTKNNEREAGGSKLLDSSADPAAVTVSGGGGSGGGGGRTNGAFTLDELRTRRNSIVNGVKQP